MKKKVVRLTESELIRLVERIVNEQKEVEIEEGWMEDNFGWIKDAAKEVASLFKREIMPEIPEDELEDLKSQASSLDAKSALSNLSDFAQSEEGEEALSRAEEKLADDTLSEAVLTEGLSDRMIRILSRTGIISGIGMSASGLAAYASNIMGYIDSAFLSKVHSIIEPYCSAFCGPLGILALILGALLAIGSYAVGYNRRNR